MTGAVHLSFTDLGVLVDQVGIEDGADIAGARAMVITRKYVTAFFDQHLRGKPQPLLTKSSASYHRDHFLQPAGEDLRLTRSPSSTGARTLTDHKPMLEGVRRSGRRGRVSHGWPAGSGRDGRARRPEWR